MDPFMVSCYMMTSQKRLVEPSMRLEFNDVDDEHQAIMPQSILRSLSLEDGSNSDMSSKSTAPSSGSEESFVYDHIYKGIKGFFFLEDLVLMGMEILIITRTKIRRPNLVALSHMHCRATSG